MELIIIPVLLVGVLIFQQVAFSRLIKDLTDRLMARDLRDYEQSKNPPPPRPQIKVPDVPRETFDRIVG